jgi:hypothetical protein
MCTLTGTAEIAKSVHLLYTKPTMIAIIIFQYVEFDKKATGPKPGGNFSVEIGYLRIPS